MAIKVDWYSVGTILVGFPNTDLEERNKDVVRPWVTVLICNSTLTNASSYMLPRLRDCQNNSLQVVIIDGKSFFWSDPGQ